MYTYIYIYIYIYIKYQVFFRKASICQRRYLGLTVSNLTKELYFVP